MNDGERLRLIATNLRCNGECADGDFVDYCAGRLNKQDAELVTRVAALEAALKQLARQYTTEELRTELVANGHATGLEDDEQLGDYPAAYDGMILDARKALGEA